MKFLPICAVTGRIAGDPHACGDCDPCILGASSVPPAVKELFAERDEWADRYAGAMMDKDEMRDDIIEECAQAAEQQDRAGREWVPDSLWANILRRAGAEVRKLKSTNAVSDGEK